MIVNTRSCSEALEAVAPSALTVPENAATAPTARTVHNPDPCTAPPIKNPSAAAKTAHPTRMVRSR